MSYRHLSSSLSLIVLLVSTRTVWAGAAQGDPEFREQFLAHVCKSGPNAGDPCTFAKGDPNHGHENNVDCPQSQCVIDYSSKNIKAQIALTLDEHVLPWDPPTVETPTRALTVLVCVKKKGQPYCFTQTYRGVDPTATCSSGDPLLSIFVAHWGCVDENRLTSTSNLLHGWQFFVPEGLVNPEGDLAQGLRDLLQATGVLVVTDIGPTKSIHVDDHTGDEGGSTLRFTATLRFVSGVDPDLFD